LLDAIPQTRAPDGTTIISDCWKAYSRIDKLGKEYRQSKMGSQSKIPCPVCGKLYAIGQGLRTHMSRMHKNEFKEMKNTQ
jgi:hypothetical protein